MRGSAYPCNRARSVGKSSTVLASVFFLVGAGHLFVFILSLEDEASHGPGDSRNSQSVYAFG